MLRSHLQPFLSTCLEMPEDHLKSGSHSKKTKLTSRKAIQKSVHHEPTSTHYKPSDRQIRGQQTKCIAFSAIKGQCLVISPEEGLRKRLMPNPHARASNFSMDDPRANLLCPHGRLVSDGHIDIDSLTGQISQFPSSTTTYYDPLRPTTTY